MNTRIKLGWICTFLWIGLWCVLLVLGWDRASVMTFNEWGDFFAGASSPLAFLWLVIGYFQQGEELGQNTKALEQQERALQLQVDELRQSVEQQNKSAVALDQQSKISGLMAKLEATNRIMESIERKIKSANESNSANAPMVIKELTAKQKAFELSLEKLLSNIENIGNSKNECE